MPSLTLWDDSALHSMFSVEVPLIEKVVRPILVYLSLMALLRVFGKRELAQLNPFDFIILVMLSNTVQNAIIGDDTSLTGGLVGAFALCAFHFTVLRVMYRHRRLEQALEGKPVVLIDEGRVNKKALRRQLISMQSLLSVARRQGFAHLDEVDRCVLEPGGTFTLAARRPHLDDLRHNELIARLDALSRQVAELQGRLDPSPGP